MIDGQATSDEMIKAMLNREYALYFKKDHVM